MISEADQKEIMAAVARAEAATDGEIVCVMSRQVSAYPEVSLAAGAAAALVGPPIALALGVHPADVLDQVLAASTSLVGWAGAGLTKDAEMTLILDGYAILQAILFTVVTLLATIPGVRHVLTPKSLKKSRVHKAAWAQFAATGLQTRDGRTGVVIFASLDDRMVEILAAEGIHAKVGDAVWNAAVKAVQEGMKAKSPARGFVQAVEICGAALAEHFPATGPNGNDLSDRLLEL
jgi:putative membrane protein